MRMLVSLSIIMLMQSTRSIVFIFFFLISFSVCVSGREGQMDGSVAGDEAMERLRGGEILIENARTDESGGSVRVQALMHSELTEIWRFIASCESVFKYVQGLRLCELISVVEGPGMDTTTLRQSVKKSWIIPKIDYTMEVRRHPMEKIDFNLLEGDLKAMDGGWRFSVLPDDQGIVVTHEIRVRPSFPVPRWLIRRSIRKDIPDMLACLRGLTGGSGKFPVEQDLKRCPKESKRKKS